jgi:hypothetical protein
MKNRAEATGLGFDLAAVEDTFRLAPDPLGELRESKLGIYRLMRDFIRPIGEGDCTNEAVHPTALERMESPCEPPYHPSNLLEYLQRPHTIAAMDPPEPSSPGPGR